MPTVPIRATRCICVRTGYLLVLVPNTKCMRARTCAYQRSCHGASPVQTLGVAGDLIATVKRPPGNNKTFQKPLGFVGEHKKKAQKDRSCACN